MKPIKKMAMDLGFMGNGSRKIREITPQDVLAYLVKRWPDLGYEDPNNWNNSARAFKTFGAFLHFEAKGLKGQPAWTLEDLAALQKEVRLRSERKRDPPELSEDLITRWEQLLEIIKKEDPYIYGMAAWSYYTCMRYDEVRRMNQDLETGSAITQVDGSIEVDGKRNKGDKAFRKVPIRSEAKNVLTWWTKYRKANGITSEALFPAGQTGERRSVSSSTYNRRLRLLARASNLFKGTCNDKGDNPTGELRLLKSHTIGRHAGATVLAHGKASEKDIQRQTGHKDRKILDRYINIDSASVSRRLQESRTAWKKNGNDSSSDQVEVEAGSLKDMIMTAIRELSPEDKKALGMEILKEVMS